MVKTNDITIEQFNAYTGNYQDSAEEVKLKKLHLDTAKKIVNDYLGYDPTYSSRFDIVSGTGTNKIFLYSKKIDKVNKLIIDNVNKEVKDLLIEDNMVMSMDYIFTEGVDNVVVFYDSGYKEMPPIITSTILRIATLLHMEGNENIGVTGKSFSDNSRTFISYTNYNKYLQPLNEMKVFRL